MAFNIILLIILILFIRNIKKVPKMLNVFKISEEDEDYIVDKTAYKDFMS